MLCRGWRWALVLSMGLSVAPVSAAEPTADERAQLEALLRQGADAAKAKDWKACVDARWAALAIEDAARTAGDLGLCEEQAGRFGDAMNHLRRALAEVTPGARTKEPWKSYQAAVIRLQSQVAMVVITMYPSGAYLVVDGRPYGKADGQLIAMSYGKHTLVARAAGYEDASETRLVTAGGVPNIHLHLKPKSSPVPAATPSTPLPAPLPAAPPVAPRTEGPPSSPSPFPCLPARSVRGVLVPLACVTGAAFVASAATTIGFELHAASMRAGLAARGFAPNGCAPGQPATSSTECIEIRGRVQQRVDATNVMLGTGIAAAALAVGAGLSIALEPGAKAPKVTAGVGPNGGGVVIQGAW